jgi:hypothetical protein
MIILEITGNMSYAKVIPHYFHFMAKLVVYFI